MPPHATHRAVKRFSIGRSKPPDKGSCAVRGGRGRCCCSRSVLPWRHSARGGVACVVAPGWLRYDVRVTRRASTAAGRARMQVACKNARAPGAVLTFCRDCPGARIESLSVPDIIAHLQYGAKKDISQGVEVSVSGADVTVGVRHPTRPYGGGRGLGVAKRAAGGICSSTVVWRWSTARKSGRAKLVI